MEIERKFQVDTDTAEAIVGESEGKRLLQGYLAIAPDGREVRIRDASGKLTLTVKAGKGLSRSEVEVEISRVQFDELYQAVGDFYVEKTRYKIPIGIFTAELDVYEGKLKGLAVVEVEFESEEDAKNFEPPEWFGDERTDDPTFKNAQLAMNSFRELSTSLA